jgi:hypothetical protein
VIEALDEAMALAVDITRIGSEGLASLAPDSDLDG